MDGKEERDGKKTGQLIIIKIDLKHNDKRIKRIKYKIVEINTPILY